MERTRAWFKVADPAFEVRLFHSHDWQYIAPKWRMIHNHAVLAQFVEEVQSKCAHDHCNDEYKIPECHNAHCYSVEVLYYMTHYYFPGRPLLTDSTASTSFETSPRRNLGQSTPTTLPGTSHTLHHHLTPQHHNHRRWDW